MPPVIRAAILGCASSEVLNALVGEYLVPPLHRIPPRTVWELHYDNEEFAVVRPFALAGGAALDVLKFDLGGKTANERPLARTKRLQAAVADLASRGELVHAAGGEEVISVVEIHFPFPIGLPASLRHRVVWSTHDKSPAGPANVTFIAEPVVDGCGVLLSNKLIQALIQPTQALSAAVSGMNAEALRRFAEAVEQIIVPRVSQAVTNFLGNEPGETQEETQTLTRVGSWEGSTGGVAGSGTPSIASASAPVSPTLNIMPSPARSFGATMAQFQQAQLQQAQLQQQILQMQNVQAPPRAAVAGAQQAAAAAAAAGGPSGGERGGQQQTTTYADLLKAAPVDHSLLFSVYRPQENTYVPQAAPVWHFGYDQWAPQQNAFVPASVQSQYRPEAPQWNPPATSWVPQQAQWQPQPSTWLPAALRRNSGVTPVAV